jgi:transcriptional regulator with XRE-family HTH domain
MGFATKFRELREKRGISPAAADEYFGLMRGTVTNWENGFSEPEEELLEDIARYFGVKISELTMEA